MFYTGGPVSDLIGESLQAVDDVTSGRSDIFKSSGRILEKASKVFVPGSAIARSYEKAVRAFQNGDMTAFMNFITTAPYLDAAGDYK
jgi:hypothetical protein